MRPVAFGALFVRCILALVIASLGEISCVSPLTSSTSTPSGQTWTLNIQGQLAYVTLSSFTNSGTFSETSSSPGVYITGPDGVCRYRLQITGTVAHSSGYDEWYLQGLTGAGCGLQTLGNGAGRTTDGQFPNASHVSGAIQVTTQVVNGPTRTDSYR